MDNILSSFEYLSVLVSIIVGLAITHLLSATARLIQMRHRIRFHATTLCWMTTLFLINIQVWWVAFERRHESDWTFFSFLLYLLIPIVTFLLSYLILPGLDDDDTADLAANFDGNRGWIFGLLALLPTLSLIEETARDGRVPQDADAIFRVVFIAAAMVAGRVAHARFHMWNAIAVLLLVGGYIALLFFQLR